MAHGNGADKAAVTCLTTASYPNPPPSSLMWQCRPSWNRPYELQHTHTKYKVEEEKQLSLDAVPCLVYSFLNFRIDGVKTGAELKKCASGGGGAVKSVKKKKKMPLKMRPFE